jgi:hypothetical protein
MRIFSTNSTTCSALFLLVLLRFVLL